MGKNNRAVLGRKTGNPSNSYFGNHKKLKTNPFVVGREERLALSTTGASFYGNTQCLGVQNPYLGPNEMPSNGSKKKKEQSNFLPVLLMGYMAVHTVVDSPGATEIIKKAFQPQYGNTSSQLHFTSRD